MVNKQKYVYKKTEIHSENKIQEFSKNIPSLTRRNTMLNSLTANILGSRGRMLALLQVSGVTR